MCAIELDNSNSASLRRCSQNNSTNESSWHQARGPDWWNVPCVVSTIICSVVTAPTTTYCTYYMFSTVTLCLFFLPTFQSVWLSVHPALVQLHRHTAATLRRDETKKNRKVAPQSSLRVASLTHSGLLVSVLSLDLEVTLFFSVFMIAIFFLLKTQWHESQLTRWCRTPPLAETRWETNSNLPGFLFCFFLFLFFACVCEWTGEVFLRACFANVREDQGCATACRGAKLVN